jgi:hypothetical protein
VRSKSVAGRVAASVVLSAILLSGCTGGATSSPVAVSPTPTVAPTGSPVDFDLEVVPAMSVGRTIGGQQVVFLVSVGGSAADGPVEIAATAAGASVSIEPQPLPPGVVGEVSVVPAAVDSDVELEVVITATRGGTEKRESRTLAMAPGDDTLRPEADQHLDPFVAWLATTRPELGIDEQTTWEATPGSWVLVVNHYLYFSEAWEVGLDWHVMIPPDDWSRIYLRRRWTETRPSLAFEISSVAGGSEPHEIAPPEDVWR